MAAVSVPQKGYRGVRVRPWDRLRCVMRASSILRRTFAKAEAAALAYDFGPEMVPASPQPINLAGVDRAEEIVMLTLGPALTLLPSNVGKNRISQCGSNKYPTASDEGAISQLNPCTLLSSDGFSTTNETKIVTVKARDDANDRTIRFQLSSPWKIIELQKEVEKRLQFEAGTYCISYIDEENEIILITCDEDLKDCISSSIRLGTNSALVLLEPK